MNCWKCHKLLDEALKFSFRSVCSYCDADLHVCTNCKYYAPGKPYDCIVPGVEQIRDKEKNNFCEDFKPKLREQANESQKKFNSLFK